VYASRRAPFFIVGSDRSGTTLLRLYLAANSRLAVPSESWFLIELFAAFPPGSVLDAAAIDRATEIVTTHSRYSDGWRVDPVTLRHQFDGVSGVTLAEFIDTLFRLETGVPEDGRWGDKTPEYAMHIDELATVFPGAQFLHIVRDGRDVYLSLAEKRWRHRGSTPYELGRYWSRTVSVAHAAGERLGDQRYLLVKYEDLVLHTRTTLERVTAFLGAAFEESMLDAHGEAGDIITGKERSAGVHDKLFRPPRRADVARWRGHSRDFGVILASGMMAEQLEAFRYPDPPTAPVALLTRNLAAYHHLWLRYGVARLKRWRSRLRPERQSR